MIFSGRSRNSDYGAEVFLSSRYPNLSPTIQMGAGESRLISEHSKSDCANGLVDFSFDNLEQTNHCLDPSRKCYRFSNFYARYKALHTWSFTWHCIDSFTESKHFRTRRVSCPLAAPSPHPLNSPPTTLTWCLDNARKYNQLSYENVFVKSNYSVKMAPAVDMHANLRQSLATRSRHV